MFVNFWFTCRSVDLQCSFTFFLYLSFCKWSVMCLIALALGGASTEVAAMLYWLNRWFLLHDATTACSNCCTMSPILAMHTVLLLSNENWSLFGPNFLLIQQSFLLLEHLIPQLNCSEVVSLGIICSLLELGYNILESACNFLEFSWPFIINPLHKAAHPRPSLHNKHRQNQVYQCCNAITDTNSSQSHATRLNNQYIPAVGNLGSDVQCWGHPSKACA